MLLIQQPILIWKDEKDVEVKVKDQPINTFFLYVQFKILLSAYFLYEKENIYLFFSQQILQCSKSLFILEGVTHRVQIA